MSAGHFSSAAKVVNAYTVNTQMRLLDWTSAKVVFVVKFSLQVSWISKRRVNAFAEESSPAGCFTLCFHVRAHFIVCWRYCWWNVTQGQSRCGAKGKGQSIEANRQAWSFLRFSTLFFFFCALSDFCLKHESSSSATSPFGRYSLSQEACLDIRFWKSQCFIPSCRIWNFEIFKAPNCSTSWHISK